MGYASYVYFCISSIYSLRKLSWMGWKYIQALKDKPNIKQALETVGLVGKGKNYQRANRLLEKL